MKIIGLDGKKYSFNLKQSEVDDDNRSSFHLKARQLIKLVFPTDLLLEEVILPGANGLRADFFLPSRKCIIEIHGAQHYKFTPFFHKTITDFNESKKRDIDKIHWARLNKICLLELDTRYVTSWTERLRDFFNYNSASQSC